MCMQCNKCMRCSCRMSPHAIRMPTCVEICMRMSDAMCMRMRMYHAAWYMRPCVHVHAHGPYSRPPHCSAACRLPVGPSALPARIPHREKTSAQVRCAYPPPGSVPVGPVHRPGWTRRTRTRTGPYPLDPYVPRHLRNPRVRASTGTDSSTTGGAAALA